MNVSPYTCGVGEIDSMLARAVHRVAEGREDRAVVCPGPVRGRIGPVDPRVVGRLAAGVHVDLNANRAPVARSGFGLGGRQRVVLDRVPLLLLPLRQVVVFAAVVGAFTPVSGTVGGIWRKA